MKLEIKYLAPYLPYGVRFLGKRKGWVSFSDDVMNLCPVDLDGRFDEIKPLLLPLSNLSTGNHQLNLREKLDIVLHDSNNICFVLSNIGKSTFGIYWSLFDNRDIEKHVPLSVYEYLFENHFDVFSLIPAGLAIDKTTI